MDTDQSAARPERIALKVLAAISFSHFLNDMLQSLIPALYPLLKESFQLSFTQIGLITLTFQLSASLLQPAVACTPTATRCRSAWPWAWVPP